MLAREWTPHILWVLGNNGPLRFGELKRLVEGISSKVLTQRLRMLAEQGIVFRDYEPTVPPKVTYGLTDQGNELDKALRSIEHLVEVWDQRPDA